MFYNMFCKFTDWRVRKVMEQGLPDAWIEVCQIWNRGNIVYRGPIGFDARKPFEFRLLESLIKEFPDAAEKLFWKGLISTDPVIKGYCIVGLELIGSHLLYNIPDSLKNNSDLIRWKLGCYSSKSSLEKFYQMWLMKLADAEIEAPHKQGKKMGSNLEQ